MSDCQKTDCKNEATHWHECPELYGDKEHRFYCDDHAQDACDRAYAKIYTEFGSDPDAWEGHWASGHMAPLDMEHGGVYAGREVPIIHEGKRMRVGDFFGTL